MLWRSFGLLDGHPLLGCWPRKVLCYHRIVVIESKLTFVLEFLDEIEIAGGNIDTRTTLFSLIYSPQTCVLLTVRM